MAAVHPISLSSTFWDPPAAARRDSSGLHAIRRDIDSSAGSKDSLDGSTVHVDGKTGQLLIGNMHGKMQDAEELDCVLLWDDDTKSYVLHRLSTSTRLSASGSAATITPKSDRFLNSTTARSPAFTTSKVSTTAHLSPLPNQPPLRSSASPSPRPPQSTSFGLGISTDPASSAVRPHQVGRKGVLPSASSNNDVEVFDNDLASPSEQEDSDDDIDFDDGLALPPSQAPVPTPGMPFHSPFPPTNNPSFAHNHNNAGAVVSSSDEEASDDDEEDEGDFADLANDLEVSLGPTRAQAAPVQQQQIARKAVPAQKAKARDPDLASSSESDEESGSEA